VKIVFFGNGQRGLSCLQVLRDMKCEIAAVVIHPPSESQASVLGTVAESFQIPVLSFGNPNASESIAQLKTLAGDLFVLAGYGKIVRKELFELPRLGAINLHAGKLPKYRGSSPMNWALINGEKSFTLSIIKVDSGVDTGDVLMEKTFPVSINDTIVDLHKIANQTFPVMLAMILKQLSKGKVKGKVQSDKGASYYPLRFPEDGLIVWDDLTAEQVHNQIRALTEPYPCAFTFIQNRKVKLIASELSKFPYYGEPGRIYSKSDKGLLVCAADRCLLIKKAVFAEDGQSVAETVKRYDRFLSLRGFMINHFAQLTKNS
jgi:methionyl-tRNA formyltransferase